MSSETETKTKVFVVNKSNHDFSDAGRFGEVVFLTETPINRYATNHMCREFEARLKNSGPNDYILITGLSVMSSIACAIFATIHSKLNLLLYRTPTEEKPHYVCRNIIFGNDGVTSNMEDQL